MRADGIWKSQLPTTASQIIILDRVKPWGHTEGHLTPRWWPESVLPGFPEMTHFASKQAHAASLLGANLLTFFFALMGMVRPYLHLGIGGIQTQTRISTPMPPFWQEFCTNPAPHSHRRPQTN
jgi:hypothetical protein